MRPARLPFPPGGLAEEGGVEPLSGQGPTVFKTAARPPRLHLPCACCRVRRAGLEPAMPEGDGVTTRWNSRYPTDACDRCSVVSPGRRESNSVLLGFGDRVPIRWLTRLKVPGNDKGRSVENVVSLERPDQQVYLHLHRGLQGRLPQALRAEGRSRARKVGGSKRAGRIATRASVHALSGAHACPSRSARRCCRTAPA